MRMLIDTNLGEGFGKTPFITARQTITGETIIRSPFDESFWVSRGTRLSLMGSIVTPDTDGGRDPDFLHFANWKKLNDAVWKAPYYEGRSFNYTPYSVGDSAVCYYYEPAILEPDESFTCSIFLATEDEAGFVKQQTGAASPRAEIPAIGPESDQEPSESDKAADMQKLRELLEILDKFIAGEIILTETDLADIDESIIRLRTRYQ
jgi:hypothetical protein